MRKITYYCDRCGKEIGSTSIWRIPKIDFYEYDCGGGV